ncbi:hypothetical protein JNB63_02125 [Microbacterium trichothecenolyticum]|uniref:hypothetical protein n=1 Tax=Microbacterium trichothecenolyticum TaxID=69370 RepID=UPI001C6E13B9|nr:hypothetical protein [Microbacterium trichothecenolyticum]MBW9118883.1 hypothetical protein [Microbacterium trichothecenolyticum]
MAGMSLTIAAHQYKSALHAAALALWPQDSDEFGVFWGQAGPSVPDQWVEFHGSDNATEPATMGSNRTAEETLNLETHWFVQRWGDAKYTGPEAESYLFARLGQLEQYVRVTNTTLAGLVDGFTVRQCRLATYATDDAAMTRNNSAGRMAAAIAIFEAKVRLTITT